MKVGGDANRDSLTFGNKSRRSYDDFRSKNLRNYSALINNPFRSQKA
jgi:hypothetical protein